MLTESADWFHNILSGPGGINAEGPGELSESGILALFVTHLTLRYIADGEPYEVYEIILDPPFLVLYLSISVSRELSRDRSTDCSVASFPNRGEARIGEQ
jgi:hypothetical protein